jgi:hypothetical protein
MSKTYLHGSEIVLDNPVEADAQVTIKSKDKIQFNIGGNDVFEITSAGAEIETTGRDLTIDDVLTVNGIGEDTTYAGTDSALICAGGGKFGGNLWVQEGKSIIIGTDTSAGANDRLRLLNQTSASYIDYGAGNLSIRHKNNGSMMNFVGTTNVDCKVPLNIDATTDSTSTSTGALIVDGGVGIDKNINVGGNFRCTSTENATSTSTGAISATNGGISCNNDLYVGGDIDYVGVITDVSDKRIKSNISPVGASLKKLQSLNPCTFDINMNGTKKHKSGFIAQELEILFPEVVVKKPTEVDGKMIEDFRRVRETELIPYLVKAIQELADKKENVESSDEKKINNETIKALEEKINELQKMEPLQKEEVEQPQIDNEILKAYEEKISNLEKMNEEKTQKIAQLQADVNKLDKNSKKLNLNLVKLLKRLEKMEAQSETNSSIQDF